MSERRRALIGGQVIRDVPDVAHAVAAGGLFGLAVGLSVCLSRAWGAFGCTRLWLAACGHIPVRFMTFLDDAHRRGVLRQVGAVYQFRHARLQERLADQRTSPRPSDELHGRLPPAHRPAHPHPDHVLHRQQASPAHVPDRVASQFALLAIAWGSSFLLIKLALVGLTPLQVVAGRLITGALALGAVCALGRRRLPREPVVWLHLGVVAVVLCVLPFTLFAWAEQHIDSGLASIYNATTPLMTTLVALAALPAERPTRAKLAGLALGFFGVLVVLAPWRILLGGGAVAQLACVLATFSYGLAFVYLRRFVSPRGLGAEPLATVQVGLAAAIVLVLAPAWITSAAVPSWGVLAAVCALGVVGTGLAYVWNTNVVAGWGATSASTVTYLAPVVGVVLGVVVLGETLHWNEPLGGAIIIAGVVLARR
ncbi:DMT family transporter [Lentzea sp. JNUCC 0626]|uniref:DMT family transporter n=1 Tax=Lentzea sp. JNUCC 0626 TaxID=3367513 RepID=UPI00374A6D3D